MMCMHCEHAPCEYVCPFNATVHDSEGLNLMVYNRCAGARYCLNNCPYKARRFNYLDYPARMNSEVYDEFIKDEQGRKRLLDGMVNFRKNKFIAVLLKLLQNPDVTVRMRGVMEKCSFCIQRIQEVRSKKKIEAGASPPSPIADGEVKTACQQAL
ncbi:MAG: 4Fe-4S dicluster domain-containing protein, partial [Verrucomicrobiae bacterium]|nr:4Fe-4S dicluster domain-containing protein [Verrucomicrobiae bacterium]